MQKNCAAVLNGMKIGMMFSSENSAVMSANRDGAREGGHPVQYSRSSEELIYVICYGLVFIYQHSTGWNYVKEIVGDSAKA
ncbi:hypothetical protein KP803_14390 [Vibrio sp. ZSDE26]|uniref:Uncharacterized protein n=1 Tax=Vibrio amylolyticus TaxID=2847292 RepID=A0A9X1XK85_9VIBR|nr:hypothetical protein [Vibrio amylolyticus]MCK6264467.1 hypothetical protein [Vibrio amylolyticus]